LGDPSKANGCRHIRIWHLRGRGDETSAAGTQQTHTGPLLQPTGTQRPIWSAGATYWAHMGPMVKPCRPQRVPMDPHVHPSGTPVDPYGSAGAIQSDPSRNICASWCNRLGRQCAHLGPLVQGVNHPFQKLLPHMEIAVSSKRNHPFQNVLLAQPAQARPGLGLTNLATATRTQL